MSEEEAKVLMDSSDSEDDSEDESVKSEEPPKETAFAKEIRLQKSRLGKVYQHNAFYDKNSKAVKFLKLKKSDPDSVTFVPGSYVWVPDKEKLYVPAKVISQIDYSAVAIKERRKAQKRGKAQPRRGDINNVRNLMKSANSGAIKETVKDETIGQVVRRDNDEVVLLNVSEKAAKNLLPMREEHLKPGPVLDINTDDLSPATIMHYLRYQFETEKNPCVQIGEETLVYLNRFLSKEDELILDMQIKMEKRKEIEDEENKQPEVSINKFAEQIFHKLNKNMGTQPQSCVIIGNKDSNRRNVTSSFARKVVQLSNPRDATWFAKLEAADDILSVFGGENFLRWTELHMNYKETDESEDTKALQKGKLIGAAFQSFLLDTSKVVNKDSESFDIFHQICLAGEKSYKENQLGKKEAEKKALREQQATLKKMTWREKQEAKKRGSVLSVNLVEQKKPKRKALKDINFIGDINEVFGITGESSYYYLNKGKLPEYRFTEAEVKDYFEDPAEKKKRIEAKKRAEEEKRKKLEENRIREEKGKALAKETALRESKERKAEKERKKLEEAKALKENKKIKKVDVATIGRADKNKFLETMERTNKSHLKKRNMCQVDDCEKPTMGTEVFCTTHFFAESKKKASKAEHVAQGKPSGAASEHRNSKVTLADEAKKMIAAVGNSTTTTDTDISAQTAGEASEEVRETTVEEKKEEEVEEIEESDSEDEVLNQELRWEKTIKSMRTLSIKDAEIASIIAILRDMLELGNILISNTERTDGKKKIVEVVQRISDAEKDEELIEKKIDAEEIYNPKKPKQHETLPKKKIELQDGKREIKDVAVDFLIEKKLIKRSFFGVKLMKLVTILNVRKLKIGREEYLKPLGKNESLSRRDALVRALYGGLFNWLLSVINRGISYTAEAANQRDKKKKKQYDQVGIIALLEAVGLVTELDTHNSNGLEQLINNYAQEKLHSFQTIHILEEQAKLYKQEKLTVPFATGNELVLPLILGQTRGLEEGVKAQNKLFAKNNRSSFTRTYVAMTSKVREAPKGKLSKYQKNKKTLGILDICEEQFRTPKGNDKNLIERIKKEHKNHQNMLISRSRYAFKIQHFGAKVSYHVRGFVKRAWSSVLDDEVMEFMINNTRDPLVKKLLTEHSISRQQKKLEKIYNVGMKQIQLGLAVEKMKEEKELESEGPLILSRHSVNINNSRIKREGYSRSAFRNTAVDKKNARKSVGFSGMTMTLNLAGMKRAKNVTDNTGVISSLQPMPLDASSHKTSSYAASVRNRKDAKSSTTDGVNVVLNSMNTLIVMLDVSEPHFIHCIPTNPRKEPQKLDPLYAYDQLKISGIIPFFGKRYPSSSYGTGITFDVFKRQFHPLNFLLKLENLKVPSLYMKNIQEFGAIRKLDWKIGISGTRIFVKQGALTHIETLRDTSFEDLVIYIQRHWKMGLIRKLYFVLLEEKLVNQLKRATVENDLETLLRATGKCEFYKIRPREFHIGKAKIKRLLKDKKLKRQLAEVTKNGGVGEIAHYLYKAKDTNLAPCPELIAAVEKYKILDAKANKQHEQAKEGLKKNLAIINEEFKEREEIKAEDEQFERDFDYDTFLADLKKIKVEKNAPAKKVKQSDGKKMRAFLQSKKINSEAHTSAKNIRKTVRFDNFETIKGKAREEGLEIDPVEADEIDDMEDEISDFYINPFASGRANSTTGSIASITASEKGSVQNNSFIMADTVEKGGISTNVQKFNELVEGDKNKEGAPKRSSSFFNFFTSKKGRAEQRPRDATAPRRRRGIGGTLKRFFTKFSKRRSRTPDSVSKSEVDYNNKSSDKNRNESWEEISNDSIIRVDLESQPDVEAGQVRVNSTTKLMQRIRGSYRTFRGSFDSAFKSTHESDIE